MAELPQRGPFVEHSASNIGQPLNEAAFDRIDSEMSRRINTPQPEPADPAGYADDDDDFDDVTLYDDADDDDVYRAPVAPGSAGRAAALVDTLGRLNPRPRKGVPARFRLPGRR